MCIVSNQLQVTNTKCPSVKNRILSDSLLGDKLYDGCILCVFFQIGWHLQIVVVVVNSSANITRTGVPGHFGP